MPLTETSDTYLIVHALSRKEYREIELLFLSRAIPFTTEKSGASGRFFVPLTYHSFALHEIQQYHQENRNWPPVVTADKGVLFRFSPIHLGMVMLLMIFHWWLARAPQYSVWMDSGMLAVDQVLAGDWQRTVTALTLHVDTTHLISNILGLLVFVGGVHQFTGVGVSWLLVLTAGALGNGFTACFYQDAHNAVGASTAVFAAVGLLGAFGVRRYLLQKAFRRRFFVPLLAALGLFAMLGTNPDSDVMAHLFGLGSGILVGLLLTGLPGSPLLSNRLLQMTALLATLLMIFWCWNQQLSSPFAP